MLKYKTIYHSRGSTKGGFYVVMMEDLMEHCVFAVSILILQALLYFYQSFPNLFEAFNYFEVLDGVGSVFFQLFFCTF